MTKDPSETTPSLPGDPQSSALNPPSAPNSAIQPLDAPELGVLPPHDGVPERLTPAIDPFPALLAPNPWPNQPYGTPPVVPLAAPDLRVPWGWGELLLFLIFVVILIELTALGVSLSLMSLGITHDFMPKSPRETSIFLLVNQAILSVGIMLYLYLRIHLRYKASFWRALQWKPLDSARAPLWLAYLGCVGGGCTLALVVEGASRHLGKSVPMPIETFFQTRDTAFVLMLMSVLLAPLIEETLFRGLLYPVLARTWGIATGIVLTGILFGLMHSYQLGGSKAHIALLISVGIILTCVRAYTGSVLASFLVHLSYNGFLTVGFIASGALGHLPPR
jgi:membrane protease YdiL (CAAX protease family)